jgi:GH18 family chitinase
MLFFLFLNFVTSFQINTYFGVFDESYNLTMKNSELIPWFKFNRLMVSFANMDQYGNITNENPDDEVRIKKVISLYRKSNPQGEVFVSLYDERYERSLYAANNSDNYFRSVVKYIKKYKLDGLDLDWETVLINRYSNELVTLLKVCHDQIKISHAIWPYVHDPKTVGLLANVVDQINIMSYSLSVSIVEYLINSYNQSGFPYEKMVLGIESETQDETQETINGKIGLVSKYNLAGIFLWRLDNDPEFKTVKMI